MVIRRSNSLEQTELFPELAPLGESLVPLIKKHWNLPQELYDGIAVVLRIGSHSHGTYIPPDNPAGIDDVDAMVIVIPPMENVLGFEPFDHHTIKEGQLDCIVYSWNKYMDLLIKSNPNVIGTLWLRNVDIWYPERYDNPWRDLRTFHRLRTVSKKMYPAFVGYAKGQFHRMIHNAHQGYMGDKRKKLVEQFGYDCKNAAHLIRLLRMCVEALRTGLINVYRDDAQELKAIKQGRWSLDAVKQHAEDLFNRAESVLATSRLPAEPDKELLESLLISGYEDWWPETRKEY